MISTSRKPFWRLKPPKYRIKATNVVLTEKEFRQYGEEYGLFQRTSERISDMANSLDNDFYSLCSVEYESDEESTTNSFKNVSSSELFATTISENFNTTEEEIAKAYIPLPQKYQYNDQVRNSANELSTTTQGYMIYKNLVTEEGKFNI